MIQTETKNISLISVIVPVYNVEKCLNRCINSILAQSYCNFELILIDDGSTDQSLKVCNEFKNIDSRIHVYHQDNKGVSSARNLGLEKAIGQFIAFVDSDDYVSSNYLTNLMKYNDFDFVTCGFYSQNSKQEWKKLQFICNEYSIDYVSQNPKMFMDKFYFGSPWAKLFKKRIITDNALKFNEFIKSGEDTLFIFDYLRYAKNIMISDSVDYYYCFYSNSLVHTIHLDYWKWKIVIEKNISDFFKCIDEKNKDYLEKRKIQTLRLLLDLYSEEYSEVNLRKIYNSHFLRSCKYSKFLDNKDDKIFSFF